MSAGLMFTEEDQVKWTDEVNWVKWLAPDWWSKHEFFKFLIKKRSRLGCFCATIGINGIKKNCFDFLYNFCLYLIWCDAFPSLKIIMNQFREISISYMMGWNIGLLPITKMEICKKQNPIVVWTHPKYQTKVCWWYKRLQPTPNMANDYIDSFFLWSLPKW